MFNQLIVAATHLSRPKPWLRRFLGRYSRIPLVVFTDCLGDTPTDLRLCLRRYLALPRANVILEREVSALEAGKIEIAFLLALLAGELGQIRSRKEIFCIGNAAPRPKGTGNNIGCKFVYTKIHAGRTIVHYFGTFGEELAVVFQLGLLQGEIWQLDMPEGIPFRSKMLPSAVARAISGDQSVFVKTISPSEIPIIGSSLVVGADRFGNVITTLNPDSQPFCNLDMQSKVRFRLNGREHEALYTGSFGSGEGLMFIKGSALMHPDRPKACCLYLVVNHARATDVVGEVVPGMKIEII